MTNVKENVNLNDNRGLDIICLGRAAVDFYGEQIGSRLEDMSSFKKYLGGSSCNIAFGTSRLGLSSAMLTRVGDEHMGRFVREELSNAGVDVSHVNTDKDRLTGLVVLGIKDRETFPLIFYRENCADMALSEEDFSPEFIASSRSLLITGTHFSTESTHKASMKAIEYAKAAGTKVIIDIDYRPVLWGLTGLGEGENRFVSSEKTSTHLQKIIPHIDLIVGTEEEVHIAGGSTDTITALKKIRSLSDATIVLKLGPLGCTVLDNEIPDSEDNFDVFTGFQVDVLNVLGAGDAFLSGFLSGWLRNESYEKCCQYANASGALVVSRHGCAPAIPSAKELHYYINNAPSIPHPDKDAQLNYLHRVTTRKAINHDELFILAFDHRKQFYDMAIKCGASEERIPQLKQLILQAVQQTVSELKIENNAGILCDDTYGQGVLNTITGQNWWIGRPVELPSSRPLELEGGSSIGSRLLSWPDEHIVKCLVFYHPHDSAELRLQQERQVKELYEACLVSGNEFLLEVIPPKDSEVNENTLIDSIKRFYNLNVYPDWWKLPQLSPVQWEKITHIIKERSPYCHGVVMLGLDAEIEHLKQGFLDAAKFPICKGFAVGRTIFSQPSERWLRSEISDEKFIQEVSDNYSLLITCWKNIKAS